MSVAGVRILCCSEDEIQTLLDNLDSEKPFTDKSIKKNRNCHKNYNIIPFIFLTTHCLFLKDDRNDDGDIASLQPSSQVNKTKLT
jgi:hypothetical protein